MAEKGTVVVVGSGASGTACARYLARREWHVVQIERDRWGGTCLWRGCIPKKALYHCASVARGIRDADRFGIVAGDGSIDWQSVLAWKWHCQETFAGDQEGIAAGYGIELVHGEARFVSPDAVAVGDKVYSADHIVIATGSEPVIPHIPGAELADTSEDALRYPEIPKSMAIVGGGFIAMEMAGIYASFGSRVTVVTRPDRVLEMLDADLAETAVRCLTGLGVEFFPGCTVTGIQGAPGSLVLHGSRDNGAALSIEATNVILAIGRRPCVCGLEPEAADVATDDRGLVVVDEYLRTTNPRIWAVGDAAGGMMQTPVANLEGRTVGRSIDEGVPVHPDCSAMPVTCFTVPQLASVGHTETSARERGLDPKVTRIDLDGVGAAIIEGATDGFLRLVSDASSGEVLGAQVASPSASDIIYSVTVGMRTGLTAEQLGKAVAVHPSHAEMLYYAGE